MAVIGAGGSLGGLTGSNAVARLLVVISGDSRPLSTSLAQAEGSIAGFGKNAGTIGNALTRGVTLPVLALSGAALAMATSFQSAMGRVAGLTPIMDTTGQSIDQIGQSLLDLSKTVPTGPVELANALYFAGSAGLDAATAFKVVELSAKGAAIGMGDASDISKVLIAALNNYGPAALTATQAMDSLVVAIREGTAEPDQMAIALGRLLPVAKAAKVSFQEVVGSVAQLTNLGVPARVATTSLRALFSELLAPTEAAKKSLDALGLSAEGLANVLATGGPIAAFKLLGTAVHGDQQALHDIIPQIRGFTAYLGLTGGNLNRLIAIFEKTTNATGALDKAFNIISQTPAFKFEIGLNKLKVAAIEVGAKLIPVFNKISQIIGNVADVISNLPAPLQGAFADFLLLAAAAGPLLKLYAALTAVKEVTLATGAVGKTLVPTIKALTTGFLTAGIAAFAAYGSFKALISGSGSLFSVLVTGVGTLIAVKLAIEGLQTAASAGLLGVNALSVGLAGLSGATITGVAVAVGLVVTAIGYFIGQSHKGSAAAKQLGDAMTAAANDGSTLKTALQNITDSSIRAQIEALAKSLHLLNQPVSIALPKLAGGFGTNLVTTLDKISAGLHAQGASALVSASNFDKYVSVISQAVAANQDIGRALKQAGLDGNEFVNMLGSLSSIRQTGGLALQDLGTSAQDLLRILPNLQQAFRDYNNTQIAAIFATQADQQATDAYAKQLGVSSDYLQSRLQATGVSAAGMSTEAKNAFETMLGGANRAADGTAASFAAMKDAIAQSVTDINSSVESSFALFDKLPKAVKQSTAQLVAAAAKQSQAIIDEVSNLQTLSQRGVPVDVLKVLADQGPQFVSKFVDASASELRRLVTVYEAQLGAVDDSILAEGAHQQVKGHNMVQDFVSGILSSSQLAPGAAHKIVTATVNAFAAGKVGPAGLQMALTFVQHLATVQGLSKAQGAKAAQFFTQGIISGSVTSKSGEVLTQKLIQGLQKSVGLTKTQARKAADAFGQGISQNTTPAREGGAGLGKAAFVGAKVAVSDMHSVGADYATQFAAGLTSQDAAVVAAANHVGQVAKTAMLNAMRGSPEFFTFYIGQKLIDDLKRGMATRNIPANRPAIILPKNLVNPPESGGGKHVTVNVHIGHAWGDHRQMKKQVSAIFDEIARDRMTL